MTEAATIALFSYGTLQQPEVQRANYRRLLDGEPDALLGYRLAPLPIDDSSVVEISGKAVHTIACPTGDPADRIPGMVFRLTVAELAATDAYETSAYSRIEVRLESGRTAWVYVGPPL
jgi:gamma-glutamylcyclotransferase (GGCT)/AIG2-like uncharacterized protein YtfP